MLSLPREKTVTQLYDLEARFILLIGKKPRGRIKGLYTVRRKTPAQILKHLASSPDAHVAIEPASLGYAVVDVDGARKNEQEVSEERIGEVARKVLEDHLGADAAMFPSLSGGGKCHIWRRIDSTLDAPLGWKSDGEPYISAPTDMYLDRAGKGSGSAFDIRYEHSYVRVTNYLDALAAFVTADKSEPFDGWPRMIEIGHRYKGKSKKTVQTADRPALTSPDDAPDEAACEKMNRAYIDKLPALAEGSRHNILNSSGFKAGQEAHWNPGFITLLDSWARGQGAPANKLKTLHKAYEEGLRKPVNPPARKVIEMPKRPSQPPVSAYESDPEAKPRTSASVQINEFAIAQSFLTTTERKLVYDIETKQFLLFADGWKRQVTEDVKVRVRRFLALQNPDPYDEKAAAKYGSELVGSRVAKIVSEIVALRGSERFDQNDLLVGLPDGLVYDVKTGETRPAKIDDMISIETGCKPKKGPSNVFKLFLETTFAGDQETAAYILRFLGYALTGSTAEHRFLFFQGAPATGKSAFLDVVNRIFGAYCKSVPSRTFVKNKGDDHPTIVANLAGPRLVYFAETGDGAKLDDEMINSCVAGDKLSARVMHGNWYEIEPKCKLVMSSNFRPWMSGPESGVYRRLRLVHFKHEIPEQRRIQNLGERMFANEGPAILYDLLHEATAWWQALQRSGGRTGLLPESESVKRETQRYFDESDPVGEFIELHIVFDADARVSRPDLHKRYRAWATDEGHAHIPSQTSLTRKIMNRLSHKGVTTVRTATDRYFAGIYLKSQIEANSDDSAPF